MGKLQKKSKGKIYMGGQTVKLGYKRVDDNEFPFYLRDGQGNRVIGQNVEICYVEYPRLIPLFSFNQEKGKDLDLKKVKRGLKTYFDKNKLKDITWALIGEDKNEIYNRFYTKGNHTKIK